MSLIIVWVLMALVVAWLGDDRVIGFGWSLVASLLLSPFIGFIIVVCSQSKKQRELELQTYQAQAVNNSLLAKMAGNSSSNNAQASVADELEKLKKLQDSGVISPEEYQKMKNKLIAQFD